MTARPKSCLAGDVSAQEGTGYPEVSGVLENSFLVGSFVSHRMEKKSRDGERLRASSGSCLQAANVSWMVFFLLLTQEGFARGSSCWVHSGNKTEKIAKNQNHQKETKKRLNLESSKVRMDLSLAEAAGGTPQVHSPRHPEALAGLTAPWKQWLRSHREGALLGTGRARRALCHSTCRGICTFHSMCPSGNPLLQQAQHLEMNLGAKSSSLLPVPAVHAAFPMQMFSLLPKHVKKNSNSCFKTLLELLEVKKINLCSFLPTCLFHCSSSPGLPLALLSRLRPQACAALRAPLSRSPDNFCCFDLLAERTSAPLQTCLQPVYFCGTRGYFCHRTSRSYGRAEPTDAFQPFHEITSRINNNIPLLT